MPGKVEPVEYTLRVNVGRNYEGLPVYSIRKLVGTDSTALTDHTKKRKAPRMVKSMSIKAALNSLLEQGFFDEPHDIKAVNAYYNSFFKPEDQKIDSDFSAQLEDLYNEGKLTKIPADRSRGETRLKFVREGI